MSGERHQGGVTFDCPLTENRPNPKHEKNSITIPLSFADCDSFLRQSRANFLVILVVTYSDLGCYEEKLTPSIDGLAANGLRFTQFYNTGRCWPTGDPC